MNILLLILITSIFMCSCEKTPNPTENDNKNLVIFEKPLASVEPTKVVYGDKIKIFNISIDSLINRQYINILFPDARREFLPDSATFDTIYSHVPYDVSIGKILLKSSGGDDSIFVEDILIFDSSPQGVKVVWSDLNYRIDEYISTFKHIEWFQFIWTVNIEEDTIKVSGKLQAGEYWGDFILNLQDKGANLLPEFLDGYVQIFTDFGGNFHYPLHRGIIKIQDWNVDSLISGRVLSYDNDYCFYYKFE